jgi:hypothetical protein
MALTFKRMIRNVYRFIATATMTYFALLKEKETSFKKEKTLSSFRILFLLLHVPDIAVSCRDPWQGLWITC